MNTATWSDAREVLPLEVVSRRVRLSQQTLVRWVDRHLVDALLSWRINERNEEERTIQLTASSLAALEGIASAYRSDVVTRTEARRILKVIDRAVIKRLVRTSEVECREVDGETCILVGSIEDYLIGQESHEVSA